MPAHKRFLSSIARRLDQLGALTKGQRDTSSGGLFTEKDNLESKYASRWPSVACGHKPAWSRAGHTRVLMHQMGLENILNPTTKPDH